MPQAAYFVLLLTAAAMILDIACGKIGNLLIMAGLTAAFWLRVPVLMHEPGAFAAELWFYLSGIGLPFIFGFPLFHFRMIGAGDVKLFMAIGGFLGPSLIVEFMAVSVVCGALISFLLLITTCGIRERLTYLAVCLARAESGKRLQYRADTAAEFHFSVPVFMTALLYMGGMFG